MSTQDQAVARPGSFVSRLSFATLSHCQRHIHVSHRRIAPFRVCSSRAGGSVCKASLACICTCLQWFLIHTCASSMWNQDSSVHRDVEDTVRYHCCALYNVQTAVTVSRCMHTNKIMSALFLATMYSSWSGPSVSNSYVQLCICTSTTFL